MLIEQPFLQILLLLGTAVAVVLLFQKLRMPSALSYLLVGIVLGPHTAGPIVDEPFIRALGEFGIVFLLFTIGLNFSLPQILSLRSQVLGLGTGQVAVTTAVIGLLAWLLGLPPEAAFVVGAVFAQSSTTIISKQLHEQGEEQSRHGRLGLAMSVFQDVTAVPIVVVIPVLGAAAAQGIAGSLASALTMAVLAFALVFLGGRRLLRPLFHAVAARRSPELFTLTVLLVTLLAAAIADNLGLSMAFGAFLAGMVLGETEFRHQVESTIRPFRDVLLGVFFVSIGMLFDPFALPEIWLPVLLITASLFVVKTLLVVQIARWAKVDISTAWRTGLLLAVGGEFGFALLALGQDAAVLDPQTAQIALMAVFFSMVIAPFLIRYNHALTALLVARPVSRLHDAPLAPEHADEMTRLRDHVIICGYGRIGQSVGHLLEEERIPYVALDLDPSRVREARVAGEPVYYGDSSERDILEAVGAAHARLIVVSHGDIAASLRVLQHVRSLRPGVPVMVRTADDGPVEQLRAAGATEVVPETLEASLMIASHALLVLEVPLLRVLRRIQRQWSDRYQLMREMFRGDTSFAPDEGDHEAERLRPILLPPGCRAVGATLDALELKGVIVTALAREGKRMLNPSGDTSLEAGDVLVLFGSPEDLQHAESDLLAHAARGGGQLEPGPE